MSRTSRTRAQRVRSASRAQRPDPRIEPRDQDPGRRGESPRQIYRQLGMRGLRAVEAGNITAYLHGLAPVERGWTAMEIERLLFVRYLVERGRLGS
jgi:hypothetical protein